MITRIDLKHFKCFEDAKIPLAPLTLLTGLNASGKSSVLQALILLHQTMREHEWSTRLALNGEITKMGMVPDVVDEVSGRDRFSIALVDDKLTYDWEFEGDRRDMSLKVCSISINEKKYSNPETLRYLLPPIETSPSSLTQSLKNLTYINAERTLPQDVYALEDPYFSSSIISKEDRMVSLLYWNRDKPVSRELKLHGVPNTRLRHVERYMDILFPGFGIDLQHIPQTEVATLRLRTSPDTEFHKPTHTGLGLTHCLPIVVAILSASPGDIIVVENPEAHIHPAGQALMGRFLANTATAGVQVLVETHSDHILNGVRRAIRSDDHIISADQTIIHFFRSRFGDGPQIISPNLDDSGNIDYWPEGFFDQFDKDMGYFAGWSD